jgi:ABC-type glutathione transport system ATPase component
MTRSNRGRSRELRHREVGSIAPLLSLYGVTKRYVRGRHEIVALDDVSLEVAPGECVAVFGSHASGKTTLLRVAAGIECADEGRVTFAGDDMTEWATSRRKHGLHPHIGWLRRSGPFLSSMAIVDYVALPVARGSSPAEAQLRATRALKRMCADGLAQATWEELSDSERTHVMLAQAVVREPALLLADDPTRGLGVGDRETMLALMRTIADEDGMAVVMTVPEVPDLLRSHTVMTLSDGELIASSARSATAEGIELLTRRGAAR